MSEGITNRQLIVVALTTATLMLAVAGGFSWYLGTQIQKLTDLANSTNSAVQSVLQLVEVGPDGIKEVAGAVAEGATTTGEAVGDALGGDVGGGRCHCRGTHRRGLGTLQSRHAGGMSHGTDHTGSP